MVVAGRLVGLIYQQLDYHHHGYPQRYDHDYCKRILRFINTANIERNSKQYTGIACCDQRECNSLCRCNWYLQRTGSIRRNILYLDITGWLVGNIHRKLYQYNIGWYRRNNYGNRKQCVRNISGTNNGSGCGIYSGNYRRDQRKHNCMRRFASCVQHTGCTRCNIVYLGIAGSLDGFFHY